MATVKTPASPPAVTRLRRLLILGGIAAVILIGGTAFGWIMATSRAVLAAHVDPPAPASTAFFGAQAGYGQVQPAVFSAPAPPAPAPEHARSTPAGVPFDPNAEAAHRRQMELTELQHRLQEDSLDAAQRRQFEAQTRQAMLARTDRARQEHEAALASPIVFGGPNGTAGQPGFGPPSPEGASAPSGPPSRQVAGAAALPGQAAAPSREDRREQWAIQNAAGAGVILDRPYLPLLSPYTLSAGSMIHASLLTALNSDLPGDIIAQVTEDVFDSATGQYKLIAAGARLMGRYDSRIAPGQERALLIWTRLIQPNGASVQLDGMPGTDGAGASGLTGDVDNHLGGAFQAIAFSTLLSLGTNLAAPTQVIGEDGFLTASRRSAGTAADQANNVGSRILDRALNRNPTITVPAGTSVNVLVNRDIILRPYAP